MQNKTFYKIEKLLIAINFSLLIYSNSIQRNLIREDHFGIVKKFFYWGFYFLLKKNTKSSYRGVKTGSDKVASSGIDLFPYQ